MEVLGIDIGGSGIKGAPVDVARGVLVRERLRVLTPQPFDATGGRQRRGGSGAPVELAGRNRLRISRRRAARRQVVGGQRRSGVDRRRCPGAVERSDGLPGRGHQRRRWTFTAES